MDETNNSTNNPEKTEVKEESKEERVKETHEKKSKEQIHRTRFLSSGWYDKNYKFLLIIALLAFALSLGYIFVFYAQHGDIMYKDVTLTGGTTITVYSGDVNTNELKSVLEPKLGEVSIRKLEDITTRKTIAFVVETTSETNLAKTTLEEYLNYSLDSSNSSIEISGSTLAQSFYKQLLIAMIIAFIFMAIVVLIIFKTLVPSLMVIFCAAADIIGTLAIVNLLGFKISTAGIAAFLMLIGYSVDTDIMLTTKVLKRRGESELNSRIKSAFKTGIIMTLTALAAVLAGYFISQADVLQEIFLILTIGLTMDIFFTWFCNASLLKFYCNKKKIS